MNNKDTSIILEDNLQAYFFDKLHSINVKLNGPLPSENIYYISSVLNKYSSSQKFYEHKDGKVQEKILGTRLLTVHERPLKLQKEELKDIGDLVLCTLGVFNDSINKKLISDSYYIHIGRSAYQRLNNLEPDYLEIDNFYGKLSTHLEQLVMILTHFSKDFFKDQQNDHFTLKVEN